ncbi:uncharacterized protein LOC118194469 [Stegodyphus dumicola]|uniref:uncharacterized protein LOC118194469 n=1 Tax=Stegodyphus dumicola TaxID=202533 RepID=UPI0015AE2291|nr:uncharacterized protein LOC118194469 [Stegodyphus dumicola]
MELNERGLQGINAYLKEKYPLALYIHCSSHSLNLAIYQRSRTVSRIYHRDALLSQLKLIKMALKYDSSPSVFEYHLPCNDKFYPHVKRLLKFLCTLPIKNCTSERSFSTLSRLKAYLRSTMHNERLNSLALLNSRNVTITPEEL